MNYGRFCSAHYLGVTPAQGKVPFYLAGCPSCEVKREAGKVTGLEQPPCNGRDSDLRGQAEPQLKRARRTKEQNMKIAAKFREENE